MYYTTHTQNQLLSNYSRLRVSAQLRAIIRSCMKWFDTCTCYLPPPTGMFQLCIIGQVSLAGILGRLLFGRSKVRIPSDARHFLFSKSPRPDLESLSLLLNRHRGSFPEVKRPGCDDESPPSTVDVKNEWSYTSVPSPCVYRSTVQLTAGLFEQWMILIYRLGHYLADTHVHNRSLSSY